MSTKIGLATEAIAVAKRLLEGDTLRIHIETVTKDELVELPRTRDEQHQKVVIGRKVTSAPEVRTEGNTTITPVVEEKAVITKRLILRKKFALPKSE